MQAGNTSKQELKLAVRSSWLVLWNHVAREPSLNPGKTTLGVCCTHDTCTCVSLDGAGRVVWHVEGLLWLLLETLLAAPCDVLKHQKGAVGDEDVVHLAVGDDCPLETVDNAAEDGIRRRGSILSKDTTGTLLPHLLWSVDSLLDVGAVEVEGEALGDVVEATGETERVKEDGASSRHVVNIEAGVGGERRVLNHSVNVARSVCSWECWERSWGWVCQVLVSDGLEAAGCVERSHLCEEGVIEVEKTVMELSERQCGWEKC